MIESCNDLGAYRRHPRHKIRPGAYTDDNAPTARHDDKPNDRLRETAALPRDVGAVLLTTLPYPRKTTPSHFD
jgi:hypothetical protein